MTNQKALTLFIFSFQGKRYLLVRPYDLECQEDMLGFSHMGSMYR